MRSRKAAAWILAEQSRVAKVPTYGCGKQFPGPLHCFRIVIYNERCNSNVSSGRAVRRHPPSWAVLVTGRRPVCFCRFTGTGGVPFLARPAFVEERFERRHRGLVGREILRDLLVEMR